MNRFGNLALLAIGFLLPLSAQATTPVSMICVAQHPKMNMSFIGTGYKWTAAHEAIESCSLAAKAQDLNASECKISECEAYELGNTL